MLFGVASPSKRFIEPPMEKPVDVVFADV